MSVDATPLRQLNGRIPKDLETICLTCLRKEPGKRYANGTDLLLDLERFNRHEPITAKPPSAFERLSKFLRRNGQVVLLSLLGAILVVGFATWWISSNASRRQLQLVTQNAELSEKLADAMSYNAHVSTAQRRAIERPLGWTWNNRSTLEATSLLSVPERNLVDLRVLEIRAMGEFDARPCGSVAKDVNPFCLAFNSDGQELAIGPNSGIVTSMVTIAALTTKREPKRLRFPSGFLTKTTGVRALVFIGAPSSHLVAGTRNGDLHVWKTGGDADRKSLSAHSSEVTGLASFAEGNQVISASKDKTVAVWQIVPEVKQLASRNIGSIISEIAMSPDSSVLAVATDAGLHMLNPTTLETLSQDAVHTRSVTFHPRGPLFARASGAHLQLAHVEGNTVTPYLTFVDSGLTSAHESEIVHCTFSPDGSWVMSSSDDHTIKLWETATGRLLARILVPGTGNTFAAFAPLGGQIAITGDHETLIYDTNDTLAQSFVAHQPEFVSAIAFHPGQATIATATESTRGVELALWSTVDGSFRKGISLPESSNLVGRRSRSLSFLESGDVLVYGGAFAGKLCRWNTVDGTMSFINTRADREVACGRRGDTIWGVEEADTDLSTPDLLKADSLLVYRFPSMELTFSWRNTVSRIQTGLSGLTSVCVGTDCALLGSRDGKVRLFQTTNGEMSKTWETITEPIHCVAQNQDESLAAWGTQDGTLEVVSIRTGDTVLRDHAHGRSIESMAFSNDGALLASGSKDGTVELRNISRAGIVHVATIYLPGPVVTVEFSPKNDKLAVLVQNERAVRIWDLVRMYGRLSQVGLDWRTGDSLP